MYRVFLQIPMGAIKLELHEGARLERAGIADLDLEMASTVFPRCERALIRNAIPDLATNA
jgi:hypothetical protein